MPKNYSYNISFSDIDWNSLHGPLPFRLSNDYLFRAVMQRSNRVLKSLICSLLHLEEKSVSSVVILNPIELGETINSKNYILDIKIDLDNRLVINLEMQVINEQNWVERSLCYLCRSFDNLNHGEDYLNVRPAVQLAILNFTLFPEDPEFYATYQLLNIKNHKLYSDRLRISVLELTQIAIATDEDKAYQLDCWARLFRATTWEELFMSTKDNVVFQEAASVVYRLSQDEKIRQQCEAREDYYRRTNGRERLLRESLRKNEQLTAQLNQANAERDHAISEIQRLRRILAEKGIDVD